MQLLPNAKSQFIDSAGQPLASGTVGFFFPGTLNPKATFQDMAGTIANPNPVPLDSRGQALIWGSGVYRQILKDASGVTIWDQITEDPNAGLTGSITDAKFVAGVDFVPGTTVSLTLPAAPGASTNMWTFFDAAYQADDQILTLVGTALTFVSPIPVGVQEVNIKIGTTVAVGIPSSGSVTDATVATGANIDSSKLSFLQAGAGALRRTVQSKLRDTVSVMDFGAKGDGTTDDTAAIQAAINAVGPFFGTVFFPHGNYLHSVITVAAGLGCSLIGESTAGVNLIFNSTTGDGITVNSDFPCTFEKLTLSNAGGLATAGSAISIPGATTGNVNSRFKNLQINTPSVGLNLTGASSWVADTVFIGNFQSAAINVSNTFNVDAGDSAIINCQFTTTSTTAAGVQQFSSGGLRLINNKHIGGFCFYQMNLAVGANTSDLIAVGNSIEGTSSSGFLMHRPGGSGSFSNVVITGNQFAGVQFPINLNDGTTGWLNGITIDGNVIPVPSGGVGVNISTAANFTISGNTFSAADSTSRAIMTSVTASTGTIGANNYANFSTAISNLSTSTTVAKKSIQGTVNVTCGAAAASLFSGNTPVTFPANWCTGAPIVTAAVAGGSNGVSGGSAAVTSAGCSITALALTNGAVVTIAYRAEADF